MSKSASSDDSEDVGQSSHGSDKAMTHCPDPFELSAYSFIETACRDKGLQLEYNRASAAKIIAFNATERDEIGHLLQNEFLEFYHLAHYDHYGQGQ